MNYYICKNTNISKWADLFEKEDQNNIEDKLFKRYLDIRTEIDNLLKEINQLEKTVGETYPLLKCFTPSLSINPDRENKSYVQELIIYINFKSKLT